MPEGDEGDVSAPPILNAPPGGGTLGGSLVIPNGGTITVHGGGAATVAGGVSEIYETEQLLDCAYLGNRVRLRCPGAAQLQVYVEPVSAAIAGGELSIKAGSDEKTATVPTDAVTITSTAATQDQGGLNISGRSNAFVEVKTVQAGLVVRVRMTARATAAGDLTIDGGGP